MKINIISIIRPPTKSLFSRFINNSFFKDYNVIYLTKIIRDNISKKNDIWIRVKKCLLTGRIIENKDLCSIIFNEIIDNNNNILLNFPKTIEQEIIFENFFKERKIEYELISVFKKYENTETNYLEYLKLKKSKIIEISDFSDLDELALKVGNSTS